MSLRLATLHEDVRSTLECGGSTPPLLSSSALFQGGVEPPQDRKPKGFHAVSRAEGPK